MRSWGYAESDLTFSGADLAYDPTSNANADLVAAAAAAAPAALTANAASEARAAEARHAARFDLLLGHACIEGRTLQLTQRAVFRTSPLLLVL